MSEIWDLSTTDASNNDSAFGFPEGMNPSDVNDNLRRILGAMARWYGDTNGALVAGGTGSAYTLASNRSLTTSYSDGQVFVFQANAASANGATLNVDSKGAKAILKRGTTTVSASDILADQIVAVAYEATNDKWQMLSPISGAGEAVGGFLLNVVEDTSPQLGGALDTNDLAINESEGSAVASATSTDIWVTDGNTLHVTGTTTITGFATAPRVGAWRKVIFDDALTLTHGANLNLPGGANITTAAGDIAFVYADTTTQFDVVYHKKSGEAVVASNTTLPAAGYTSSLTSITAGADVQNFAHGLGAVPSLFQVYLVANTTTAQGYASGTRILAGSTTGSATSAVVLGADATNVIVSFGSAINLLDLTSHGNESITKSEYDWLVKAWA
tara:strand:- start:2958 stop:4118 length:1161 start_codon:yes stop_codon:yes gene_type:complete